MFYLFGSIALLVVLGVMLVARSDLKKQALIPAILFIPYGPISELMFSRDYWSPQSSLPQVALLGRSVLIEDMIYAFSIVGIMSIAHDFVIRKKPVEGMHQRRLLLAVVLSISSLLLFTFLSLYSDLNSIFISAAVSVCAACVVVVIRGDLLKVALTSSVICGVGAFLFYFAILLIPGATEYLHDVWIFSTDLVAFWILGIPIPLTELLWAFTMPLFFGTIYKFAVGSGNQETHHSS